MRGPLLVAVSLLLTVALAGTASSQGALPAAPPASAAPSPAADSAATKDAPTPNAAADLDALLDLAEKDVDSLARVSIAPGNMSGASSSASSTLSSQQADFTKATSTGDLLKQIPSVSGRRLSGITTDPRVRGYNSSQLAASANGMTQRKSIQDLDSLLSQIDPGVIEEITVIEGPYSSLHGPGFAFINVDLLGAKRYAHPHGHSSTYFNYASNGQVMYARENVWAGARNWGMYCTYGVRTGNDYRSGGRSGDFLVPTSFERWDGMFSLSYDLGPTARLDFDMLHTEMNNVEMPGIIYDPENSANNQFNLRYVVQDDPDGPQQFVLQTWHQETFFHGDAAQSSKQQSFYREFMTIAYWALPVNTIGSGHNVSTGIRALRTFGDADAAQWTVGVDWRQYRQRYQEYSVDGDGAEVFHGNYFGLPLSQRDDIGALTNLDLPVSDRLTVSIGGRVDYATTSLDRGDPVITHLDPDSFFFYQPGFHAPSYTLGMAYIQAKQKLNDTDTLHWGTGFAMRAPDLAELYFDEPFVPYARVGNSEINGLSILKPEKNWQFDLGMTCERKPLRYGARGYYSTIWDYIMAVPAWTDWVYYDAGYHYHYLGRDFQYFDPAFRDDMGWPEENGDTVNASYQNTNIRLAMLWGCDLFGELELRRGVSLFGCVSYTQGRNLSRVKFLDAGTDTALDGTFVSIPGAESLPNIYPLNGSISLRVFDPENDRWRVEFVTRLVNAQHEVAASIAEVPSPGFVVFDLRGYYRWRENVRLSLSLENLLDTYYSEPGSVAIMNSAGRPVFMPEPGFSVLFGIDGKF
ncbi:MAG: TonB-dependent receptor [Pirellulales bacterium]|nr:TonB-dependent receptor [Pirellulales bacterium]